MNGRKLSLPPASAPRKFDEAKTQLTPDEQRQKDEVWKQIMRDFRQRVRAEMGQQAPSQTKKPD